MPGAIFVLGNIRAVCEDCRPRTEPVYTGRWCPLPGKLKIPPVNKQNWSDSAPVEQFFPQQLDHFNEADLTTWPQVEQEVPSLPTACLSTIFIFFQRFWVNDKFYKPKGPVFVMIGESEASMGLYVILEIFWLIDNLINIIIDWLLDWLVSYLIDQYIDELIAWLIDWFTDWITVFIIASVDWLIDWCGLVWF
jgi:Serine carboxypeptidase S28